MNHRYTMNILEYRKNWINRWETNNWDIIRGSDDDCINSSRIILDCHTVYPQTLSMAKHRLNVDMDEAGKRQLDQLQKKLKAPAMIDVIRKSFAVLELILDHQKDGGKVILENADGSKETLRLV